MIETGKKIFLHFSYDVEFTDRTGETIRQKVLPVRCYHFQRNRPCVDVEMRLTAAPANGRKEGGKYIKT